MGFRKQRRIDIVAIHAYLISTVVERKLGSNPSKIHFLMSTDLQAANLNVLATRVGGRCTERP